MKNFVIAIGALALTASPAVAQEQGARDAPKHEHMKDGKMECCKKDEDGKMICTMMARDKVDHSKMDHSKMDHSKMDHSKMDHSKMDHSKMDHSKMDHSKMDRPEKDAAASDDQHKDHKPE